MNGGHLAPAVQIVQPPDPALFQRRGVDKDFVRQLRER